jgi:nuclear pore complex protein Nup62
MCVCVCVRVGGCLYVSYLCMFVWIYTHQEKWNTVVRARHTWVYVCMYVSLGICMYVCTWVYVCMYVSLGICMYVCMYVWTQSPALPHFILSFIFYLLTPRNTERSLPRSPLTRILNSETVSVHFFSFFPLGFAEILKSHQGTRLNLQGRYFLVPWYWIKYQ